MENARINTGVSILVLKIYLGQSHVLAMSHEPAGSGDGNYVWPPVHMSRLTQVLTYLFGLCTLAGNLSNGFTFKSSYIQHSSHLILEDQSYISLQTLRNR